MYFMDLLFLNIMYERIVQMKKYTHFLLISIILILLSFIMFFAHYLIFGQLENTIYYSLMNLCFIPINILIVTFVFENLLEKKARLERLNKLNMLVGLFFNEIGYCLMSLLISGDEEIKALVNDFEDLKTVENRLRNHSYKMDFEKIDFDSLQSLLIKNKEILISLISNPNILEHETFTDLLMAVSHLRDELVFRQGRSLSADDKIHLQKDLTRMYKFITIQWISYLKHLKEFYPYLYKGAIQLNPFTHNLCLL